MAGARPVGTTALLEDIVVPVPALSRTMCRAWWRTATATPWSSATRSGNGFVVAPRLDDPGELAVYEVFAEDLVETGEDGSLKAEHGTGRIMAPFRSGRFAGDELYDVMREVKAPFDPSGVLNPGVILSGRPAGAPRRCSRSPPPSTLHASRAARPRT